MCWEMNGPQIPIPIPLRLEDHLKSVISKSLSPIIMFKMTYAIYELIWNDDLLQALLI